MRRTWIFWASIILVVVLAPVAWVAVFLLTPPSAKVHIEKEADGTYALHVDPNFVVNSVYRVTVRTPSGLIAECGDAHTCAKPLTIPKQFVPSGTDLTVECDLQYDHPAPSLVTTTTSLKMP